MCQRFKILSPFLEEGPYVFKFPVLKQFKNSFILLCNSIDIITHCNVLFLF